jgi:hypothetical protein
VRIDCSLCGVKMLHLHLCLSASMNIRHILHIQPLELYNEILVWVSFYPYYLSIYPYWIILLTSYTFCYHCMLSFRLP